MECVRRRAARSLRVLCSFVPNSFAEMTSRVAGAVLGRAGPHRAAPGRTEAARAVPSRATPHTPQETRPRLCC